jgi:hypothetical protein
MKRNSASSGSRALAAQTRMDDWQKRHIAAFSRCFMSWHPKHGAISVFPLFAKWDSLSQVTRKPKSRAMKPFSIGACFPCAGLQAALADHVLGMGVASPQNREIANSIAEVEGRGRSSGRAARFRGRAAAQGRDGVLELTCRAAEKSQDATSIPLGALTRVATGIVVAYVVEGVSLVEGQYHRSRGSLSKHRRRAETRGDSATADLTVSRCIRRPRHCRRPSRRSRHRPSRHSRQSRQSRHRPSRQSNRESTTDSGSSIRWACKARTARTVPSYCSHRRGSYYGETHKA